MVRKMATMAKKMATTILTILTILTIHNVFFRFNLRFVF